MKKTVAFILLLALLAGSLAGCGTESETSSMSGTNPGAAANTNVKIAFVASGIFGGGTMNDAMLQAMQDFTAETGIEVVSVEVSEFSDHAINARNFAQQGFDLVIMGGAVSEVIPEIATEYPDTHFVLNKGTISDMDNVTSVQFDEADGGFLTGVFAVLMGEHISGSKKVGWIGGERKPDLEKCRYAFAAGAQWAGGECDVVYIGNFTDVAKGSEIAGQMYSSGSAIVQAYAGGASTGIYQKAETMDEKHYVLGHATGQFEMAPDKIIASAVVNYDIFYLQMLRDYVANGYEMESGILTSGLADGGTGIKYSPTIGDQIPEEIKIQIEELKEKIINGELTVPTTEEEYAAFIAA